jgi:hypothetical protein
MVVYRRPRRTRTLIDPLRPLGAEPQIQVSTMFIQTRTIYPYTNRRSKQETRQDFHCTPYKTCSSGHAISMIEYYLELRANSSGYAVDMT